MAAVPGTGADASLVMAILEMARGLGLRVIAEGVETEEQLAFLMANGCRQAQGFLFGAPVPVGRLYTQSSSAGSVCNTSVARSRSWHLIVLADPAVAEDHHAPGELRDVGLVGDQHDGEAVVVQLLEDLHDLDRGPAVEVSGGLVGEQDRRAG